MPNILQISFTICPCCKVMRRCSGKVHVVRSRSERQLEATSGNWKRDSLFMCCLQLQCNACVHHDVKGKTSHATPRAAPYLGTASGVSIFVVATNEHELYHPAFVMLK